eukprot:GHUV01024991.1.p1 GENE.GHUV01024991.1~~GHUV01024991.1.p1  ORF type:complete len:215 (+),score=3.13 GHUV01024991.1:1599-2243(+)
MLASRFGNSYEQCRDNHQLGVHAFVALQAEYVGLPGYTVGFVCQRMLQHSAPGWFAVQGHPLAAASVFGTLNAELSAIFSYSSARSWLLSSHSEIIMECLLILTNGMQSETSARHPMQSLQPLCSGGFPSTSPKFCSVNLPLRYQNGHTGTLCFVSRVLLCIQRVLVFDDSISFVCGNRTLSGRLPWRDKAAGADRDQARVFTCCRRNPVTSIW